MSDIQLKNAAEEFVRYLRSSRTVKEFQTVQGIYQNNPEIKKLREEYITAYHYPVCPGIRSECPVDENKLFKLNTAVPGNEELHSVSISNHHSCCKNYLVHFFKMIYCNDILQIENFSNENKYGNNHRET